MIIFRNSEQVFISASILLKKKKKGKSKTCQRNKRQIVNRLLGDIFSFLFFKFIFIFNRSSEISEMFPFEETFTIVKKKRHAKFKQRFNLS